MSNCFIFVLTIVGWFFSFSNVILCQTQYLINCFITEKCINPYLRRKSKRKSRGISFMHAFISARRVCLQASFTVQVCKYFITRLCTLLQISCFNWKKLMKNKRAKGFPFNILSYIAYCTCTLKIIFHNELSERCTTLTSQCNAIVLASTA